MERKASLVRQGTFRLEAFSVVPRKWRTRLICGSLLLLVPCVALLARWTSNLSKSLTGYFVGICAGPLLAVMHVPNSYAVASSVLWKRVAASVLMVVVTAYVATYAYHCFPKACPEAGIHKQDIIMASCLGITPIAIACVMKSHPRSSYVYDAKWCVVSLWFVTVGYGVYFILKSFHAVGWMGFTLSMTLTTEGIILSWIICLFCHRIKTLGLLESRRSHLLIGVMSVAFQANIWTIIVKKMVGDLPGAGDVVLRFSLIFRGFFLCIWIVYTVLLAGSLASALKVLRREARRVRGPARLEARWARRVLFLELATCVAIGVTTFGFWILVEVIRLMELLEIPNYKELKDSVLSPLTSIAHRVDIIANALSIGFFSGVLWQIPPPLPEEDECIGKTATDRSDASNFTIANTLESPCRNLFSSKVEELAGRGVRLQSLLNFLESLIKHGIMPSFDPWCSTTNDVVRQAIIPLSRDRDASGGGSALATVWNKGEPIVPSRMVTHNWTNLFLHLMAAIVAEAIGADTFDDLAETLATPEGLEAIVAQCAELQVLDMSFWICAFSINQHASICGSFGPEPAEGTQERVQFDLKTRDTKTRARYPLCNCKEKKVFNDMPAPCELNKFDDVMRFIHNRIASFAQVIAVDMPFQVFYRAWCVAEIVEGHSLGIPAKVKIHSEGVLDHQYETLSTLDVRLCEASRPSDKEMIIQKITDVNAFNMRLQELIFGTSGLFSTWVDGQERAAQVGRIVRRAWLSAGSSTMSLTLTPPRRRGWCCWRATGVSAASSFSEFCEECHHAGSSDSSGSGSDADSEDGLMAGSSEADL